VNEVDPVFDGDATLMADSHLFGGGDFAGWCFHFPMSVELRIATSGEPCVRFGSGLEPSSFIKSDRFEANKQGCPPFGWIPSNANGASPAWPVFMAADWNGENRGNAGADQGISVPVL